MPSGSDLDPQEASATATEAGAPVPPLRAAAFFDVDNTIMRGASLFHLARGLYRRRFFTARDILRFARHHLRFRWLGENLDHLAHVRELALGFVAGHSVSELTRVGEEVFDELMARKIWPGTRSLARAHMAAGEPVWLVTATPVEVAEVIARKLGLAGALGSVAERVDGIYTGRLTGPALHGEAKARAVRELAEREGLDLARCAAYSDSAHDIPLLELVGHPCAVNPDRRLRALAESRGWIVRDFRTGRRAFGIGLRAAASTGAGATAATVAVAAVRRCHRPRRRGSSTR